MSIERVGVIGAGTMGNGIAHVFARSGYAVTLCDVEQRFLDRALETIGKNLDREVAKGKTSAEDKTAALKRIAPALQRCPAFKLRLRDRSCHREVRSEGGNFPRSRSHLPS